MVGLSNGATGGLGSIRKLGGKTHWQIIHLSGRCQNGTVQHEVLHALGFMHEHTRPDRDDYLDVDLEKAKELYGSNSLC